MKYLRITALCHIFVTFVISPVVAEVLDSQTRNMPFEECKAYIGGNGGGLPTSHYKTIINKPNILKKKLTLADGDIVMTCTKADNKFIVTRETK